MPEKEKLPARLTLNPEVIDEKDFKTVNKFFKLMEKMNYDAVMDENDLVFEPRPQKEIRGGIGSGIKPFYEQKLVVSSERSRKKKNQSLDLELEIRCFEKTKNEISCLVKTGLVDKPLLKKSRFEKEEFVAVFTESDPKKVINAMEKFTENLVDISDIFPVENHEEFAAFVQKFLDKELPEKLKLK